MTHMTLNQPRTEYHGAFLSTLPWSQEGPSLRRPSFSSYSLTLRLRMSHWVGFLILLCALSLLELT